MDVTKKRATIKDIAEKTGVSVATVSNVINGKNKVSIETKKRIKCMMEELHYQPNLIARSLSNHKVDMIGLLLPITEIGTDSSLLLKDNPFYGELISGIEYQATQFGYDILIKGVRPGESCRDWIIKRNLDGTIFLGNYTAIISEDIKDLGSQLVLMDSYDEGTNIHNSVSIDDMEGGYLATKHLLELGHRKIAIAASNIMVDGAIYRRFLGYKKAMNEYEAYNHKHLIYQNALTFEGGYEIGLSILKNIEKVSAVFAVADVVAFGIIKAFHDNQQEIPKDLSIVGFDNTKGCEYSNPSITSICQPIYKKGILAVDIVVDTIERKNVKPVHITLPVELKVRNSTAPFVL